MKEDYMRVILNGDYEVKTLLGSPQKSTLPYRTMKYCVLDKVENNTLIFNQLTKELILVEDLTDDFWVSDEAISHWCSVPVDFDEKTLVDDLRTKLRNRPIISKDINLYHIFTTTSCNARCHYCFEKGNQTCGSMSLDVADRVAEYILHHEPSDEEITLAWFGGEPLLNTAVIDRICEYLSQRDCRFHSIMATNAFLITPEIIQKAKKIWRMNTWNITLDGTEDIYNSTKNYVNVKESPFIHVLNNISLLLNAGFNINIRMNLGVHNSDDLMKLIDLLYKRFGIRENLCVYCAPLYERQMENDLRRTDEEETIVRTKEAELYSRLVSMGYFDLGLRQKLRVYRCNPDMGWAVSVLPDGRIGWCEDYVDKAIISHIDSDVFDENVINQFKVQCKELPECAECTLYPDCIRLQKCNIDTPWCTTQKRDLMLFKLKMDIRREYERYIESK